MVIRRKKLRKRVDEYNATEKKIAPLLQQLNGNINLVAASLGCSVAAVRRQIANSQYLQEIKEAAELQIVGIAENVIVDTMLNGSKDLRLDAAKFVLRSVGSRHGWGDGVNGGAGGKFINKLEINVVTNKKEEVRADYEVESTLEVEDYEDEY